MKKVLIFLLPVFLFSCEPYKFIYNSNLAVVDYGPYTSKGFFITESPSVSFEYTPIGSVSVVLQSGYEIKSQSKNKTNYGDWRNALYKDAIELLYKKCLEGGANGVVGLKYNYIPEVRKDDAYTKIESNGIISPSKIIVSGMAIKK